MYRWNDHDEQVLEWMGKESSGAYGVYAAMTWEAYRLMSELKAQSQPKRYVFTWQASGYGKNESDALRDARDRCDWENPEESKQED